MHVACINSATVYDMSIYHFKPRHTSTDTYFHHTYSNLYQNIRYILFPMLQHLKPLMSYFSINFFSLPKRNPFGLHTFLLTLNVLVHLVCH